MKSSLIELNAGRALGIAAGIAMLAILLLANSGSALSNDGGGSWGYYREITISNSGSALSDYQVFVNLTGANFPMNANTSGADIRFTDAGGNELSYWIEKWDYANESAKIWVKVPSLPAGGIGTVYMYYGNLSASSASKGDGVFEFFDDFEDGNTSDWTNAPEGGGEIESSVVYAENYSMKLASPRNYVYKSFTSISSDRIFEWMARAAYTSTNADYGIHANVWSGENTAWIQFASNAYILNAGGQSVDSITSYSANTWYKIKDVVHPSTSKHDIYIYNVDGSLRGSLTNASTRGTVNSFNGFSLYVGNNGATIYADNIFMRKYASPEPSVNVGDEQSTGLVAEYHFEGNAQDSSGNGNHGINNGATFTHSISGQALSFDGSDDYVSIPDAPSFTISEVTVEAWIKPDDTVFQGIVTNHANGVDADGSWVLYKSDKVCFIIFTNTGEQLPACGGSISPSSWHHVVGTWSSSSGSKIYLNGVNGGTVTTSGTLPDPKNPIEIGRYHVYNPSNQYWFDGTIDEVRVYNRALSAEEIKAHYEEGAGAELEVQLSYKNAINLGDSADINTKVFSDSTPVTANIEIKVNGTLVANVNSHEYTYTFTPDRVGSYTFEITANYGNLIDRKIGKIEVLGDLSKVLKLNDDTKNLAHSEIDQTVYIPADKSIDLVITIGADIAAELFKIVLDSLAKLAKTFVSEAYKLDLFANSFANYIQEVSSEILTEGTGKAIEAGFNSVEEHAIFYLKEKYESQSDIVSERNKINAKSSEFESYIRGNQEKFNGDFDEMNRLFIVYSEPISKVVETRSIASFTIGSYTLNSWTMQDEANFYDLAKKLKELLKLGALFAAVIIAVGALIIAAKATILSFGTLFPIIAAATGKILVFATNITWIGNGVLALAVISLVFSISLVAPQVTVQHSDSIEAIEEAVNGMSATDISLQVKDTKILSDTQIKSTGHTIVLTPDGKIVRILRGDGDYAPRTVGEHSAYAFLHTPQKLFYKVVSTSFNVSKPNITMNISKEVHGKDASITTSVYNNENVTIGNLTLILSIENSNGSIVYADAKMFDLNAMEYKDLNFTVTFNESDVYTASASLTIMSLFSLQDEKFPIVVENATAEDVAILKVEHKDVYSPFENVTMNVTLQAFSDMEFELNISEFNYSALLNSSVKEVTITSPKLQPEEYTVLIKAIKNNSILDSEVVRFTVKAIDVAILTFNTTRIFYNTSADVVLDLNFKNLSGNSIDVDVKVKVLHSNGTSQIIDTIKSGDAYEFRFRPPTNGTYVLEGIADKEGYRIKSETLTIIVGEMSKLSMRVNVSDVIVISTFANGMLTESNITVFYDNETISRFTSNGKAIFNASDRFTVNADKMFYEPGYFEYFSDKDITPLASVTNLKNITYATTYINWTWNDPVDAYFSQVMVYIDGNLRSNVSKGIQFYNATGFAPDTEHTISTRTVDTSANINTTWVNHTAKTAPLPVTNPAIISIANSTAPPGGKVKVPITITNVTNLGAADVNLSYNSSVVRVLEVNSSQFDFIDAVINNASGTVRIAAFQTLNPGLSDVRLAEVTLLAAGSVEDKSIMDLKVNELKDASPQGNDIPYIDIDGVFTIAEITPPIISNLNTTPLSIPDDTDNDPRWGETSRLNVTVSDESGVAGVTINLSSLGKSAAQPMALIGGSNISGVWSVTTNASAGKAGSHSLTVNAADIYGNLNTSVKISLRVLNNGDVNQDGAKTLADAMYLAKYVLSKPGFENAHPGASEVSGDGSVTLADAMYLAKNILNKPGFEVLH